MIVDNVEVTAIGLDDFTEDEAQRYIDFVKSQITGTLTDITVRGCADGSVDIDYCAVNKFERIRRITGKGCRP